MRPWVRPLSLSLIWLAFVTGLNGLASAAGNHEHSHVDQDEMLEQMMEMHKGHDHAHNFEAMEHMPPEERHEAIGLMVELGLAMPPMDSERGRELFVEKGCVVCHAVNGIGGEVGPSLNAANMPQPMNAFEFAARMWRGAAAMTQMQEQLFGETTDLTGQELADLVAFAHDEDEQRELSQDQIPDEYLNLMPK